MFLFVFIFSCLGDAVTWGETAGTCMWIWSSSPASLSIGRLELLLPTSTRLLRSPGQGQPASSEAGAQDVNVQTMMASGEQSIRERQTASGGAGADNVNEQTVESRVRGRDRQPVVG